MNKLEKYSAYKDSGVEWLGEIPEAWMTLANKHIFKIKQNLVGKKSKEYDLLSLTLKGIIKRDMDNPKGKFPTDFDTYQEVKIDDFVFCLFDVEETPRTVGLSDYDGMITGAYTVMEVNDVNQSFLYYFYLNLDSRKRLKFLYKGLRNTIPKDSFFIFKTLLPPKQEQIKIASFLDTKTEQLDKAIQQKEKLIGLLRERRQILINDAVTKGIDKTVAMKDSGVEWIGKIPKHWKIRRLASIGRFSKGGGISRDNLINYGIPAILYGDIYTKYNYKTDITQNFISKDTAKNAIKIIKGKILLTGYGETKEDIGKCIVYTGEVDAYAGGDVIIFNQKKEDSLFLGYSLNSSNSISQKMMMAKGEIIVHIYGSKLKELIIPLPPTKEEQQEIANYTEENNKKIDKAIDLQQQQITKLKEYKTTLIDSVVTGKVRVCDD